VLNKLNVIQVHGKYYKLKNSSFCLKGKDAEDYLNRFTTNELKGMEDGQYKYSVLTDFNGHIIDLILIIKRTDGLLIICSHRKYEIVTAHLDKYIMSEDVKIEKSEFNNSILIFYPFVNEEYNSLTNNVYDYDGNAYTIKDPFFRGNVRIIYSNSDGISESGKMMTDDEFEFYRISNLIPYSPGELNEKVIPLECNLTDFISFNKGCYLGQEVIARITSQNKLPKSMHTFKSDVQLFPDERIFIKNNDDENFSECGFLTSVTSVNNAFHALGFIRQKNLNEEQKYYIVRDNKYKEFLLIK